MIQSTYLNNIQKIKQILLDEGSVKLPKFFTDFASVMKEVAALKFQKHSLLVEERLSTAPPVRLDEVSAFVEQLGFNLGSAQTLMLTWKDYAIIQEKPVGYDLVIDLTLLWDVSWGGYVAYNDGEGNSVQLDPEPNMCYLAKRDLRFIKYVNHLSEGNNRCLLLVELSEKNR